MSNAAPSEPLIIISQTAYKKINWRDYQGFTNSSVNLSKHKISNNIWRGGGEGTESQNTIIAKFINVIICKKFVKFHIPTQKLN